MFKKLIMCLAVALCGCGAVQAEIEPASPIVVWGVKASPYVRKVLMAAESKEIAYELREVLPVVVLQALKQEVPVDFAQASPLGKIPAMRDGACSVSDSAVIVAYLEKAYPQHPLYPSDKHAYARALWFEKYADTAMSEVIHEKIFVETFVKPKVFGKAPDVAMVQSVVQNELPAVLDYLEGQITGKYLVGDRLSIADIAVVNHLVSLKLSGVVIESSRWPQLARYVQGMLEEPVVKKVVEGLPLAS